MALELVEKTPRSMHSPLALTFNAEIKRVAAETKISIGEIMELLAKKTGLEERQLYHYRSGKCDIPALLIPIFCRHFESNALAMTLVGLCEIEDFEPGDGLDLIGFSAKTLQDMLAGAQVFVDAAKDGKIDGNELLEIKNVFAQIVRDAHRAIEVAAQMRRRVA
jgi:hypothetical protein